MNPSFVFYVCMLHPTFPPIRTNFNHKKHKIPTLFQYNQTPIDPNTNTMANPQSTAYGQTQDLENAVTNRHQYSPKPTQPRGVVRTRHVETLFPSDISLPTSVYGDKYWLPATRITEEVTTRPNQNTATSASSEHNSDFPLLD